MAIVVYTPLTPGEAPVALRINLLCHTSRAIIMRVRSTLSARDIERYANTVESENRGEMFCPADPSADRGSSRMYIIPSTVQATSVEGVSTSFVRTWMRTNSSEICEAWEENGRVVHAVNNIAPMQLEERPC